MGKDKEFKRCSLLMVNSEQLLEGRSLLDGQW